MDSQTHGSKSSLRDVERQEVMPSEVTPLQSRTPSQHSIRSNRTIECPSGERGGGTNDVPIPMKTNGDDLCNNKLSPAVYDTEVTTAEVRYIQSMTADPPPPPPDTHSPLPKYLILIIMKY